MFIEWADRMGFFVPRVVNEELDAIRREHRGEARDPYELLASFKRTKFLPDEIAEDDPQPVNRKGAAQHKKYENNLAKVVLALLIKSDLIKRKPVDLSKMLAEILRMKAHEQGDDRLILSDDTIKARLEEASELLK